MSGFKEPKPIEISDVEYIQKLVHINMHKDLQDGEEVCPWCHGTGVVVVDNEYGLEGDTRHSRGFNSDGKII